MQIITVVNLSNQSLQVDLDDVAKTYEYDGSNLTGILFTYQGVTYKKTFTYDGSLVSGESRWEVQQTP